ncbi:MAG: thiamine-phosphate kinase [Gammaproteobacteria bacterium]|nr:thiamine-phosphate kinase [Gammaproteobacteria bacterium]
MSEFSIIKDFFQRASDDPNVIVGNGDDCAVVSIPAGYELALSIDTMVAGVHFPENTPPFDIGYKAVMSTISDLAAVGAEPKWLTGSLTLPQADNSWLQAFSDGLFTALKKYHMTLIGGDLTRGPLTITMQAHGLVLQGKAVQRKGAQVGDLIYVTNTLGDAALGLQLALGQKQLKNAEAVLTSFNRPEAQITAGLTMRDFATSAIDISDGLLQDLQHILTLSHVGAELIVDDIPLSATLKQLNKTEALQYALAGGEDYQLLMTVPAKLQQAFEQHTPVPVTCIGKITNTKELILRDAHGKGYAFDLKGYQHF